MTAHSNSLDVAIEIRTRMSVSIRSQPLARGPPTSRVMTGTALPRQILPQRSQGPRDSDRSDWEQHRRPATSLTNAPSANASTTINRFWSSLNAGASCPRRLRQCLDQSRARNEFHSVSLNHKASQSSSRIRTGINVDPV